MIELDKEIQSVGEVAGSVAASIVVGLTYLDVDAIRREGRCCEVLRTIKNQAVQFRADHIRKPNAQAGRPAKAGERGES